MTYYVIGVLQAEVGDEWRLVEAEAEADDWERAAMDAGARVAGEERWRDLDKDPERAGWNYWLLAVVELAPGLPVPYSGSEDYMPSVSDTKFRYGDQARGHLWVAAGQTEDGDTWVQRLRARDPADVLDSLRVFLDDDLPFGAYGMVREDGGGRYTVFDASGISRSVGAVAWGIPLQTNLKQRLMPPGRGAP